MGDTIDDQQVSCLWQGEYLLSVSLSGHINYLDRNNPDRPLRILKGHNKNLSAVASYDNGSTIYSASFDGRVDILNRFKMSNLIVVCCFFNFPYFIGTQRMEIWIMWQDAHTLTKFVKLPQLQINCILWDWTNCSGIFYPPVRNMGNYINMHPLFS